MFMTSGRSILKVRWPFSHDWLNIGNNYTIKMTLNPFSGFKTQLEIHKYFTTKYLHNMAQWNDLKNLNNVSLLTRIFSFLNLFFLLSKVHFPITHDRPGPDDLYITFSVFLLEELSHYNFHSILRKPFYIFQFHLPHWLG